MIPEHLENLGQNLHAHVENIAVYNYRLYMLHPGSKMFKVIRGKKNTSQVPARTVGIFGLSALESNPTQEARIYIMSKFTIAESMFQQEGVESLVFGDQLGHDRRFKRSSRIPKFRFLRHSTDILPELCI